MQQFHTEPSDVKPSKNTEAAESPASTSEAKPHVTASTLSDKPAANVDLNFREATLFIDWIQQAIAPLGKEPSLPAVPDSLQGVAREWAGVIDQLNHQFLVSEEDRTDAQRNLQSAEDMVDSLTQELGTVKQESETAQETCGRLEKRVKELEESLVNYKQVSEERDRLVSKVSTMQSELQNKGAELEGVSMTLKSMSNAIRNLLPSDRP